jgi:hypothetical protein
VDKRIGARLTKYRRGELPAGVTVNTGRVNEELARDVFWDTFVEVGHVHLSCHSPPSRLHLPQLGLLATGDGSGAIEEGSLHIKILHVPENSGTFNP